MDSSARGLAELEGGDATPSLFVAIDEDGTVHITCHRSEMGQGTWTAMAQIVADELEAAWERVVVAQATGHPRYGDQNTDGSRSVRNDLTRLRTAGAAMRTLLERAAAAHWGVRASACRAELGEVVHRPSGRRLGYGELSAKAASLPLPRVRDIELKRRADWRYIGKAISSLTTPEIVRGEGTFGIDVRLPDMLYAVVARPPQVFCRASRVDDRAALAVRGVCAP